MRLRDRYEKLMGHFLDGPDWLYVESLEKRPRSYRSPSVALAAWCYGYYQRFVSKAGRIILPVAALVMFYSMIALDSPTRIVAIVIFVILLVDLYGVVMFRPKLRIIRSVPERVRAGAEFNMRYELMNRRKHWTAWNIELDNYRVKNGISWLEHARTGVVPANTQVSLSARLFAERRGKYVIHAPIADSLFPFGIFKWSCSPNHTRDLLLVYPPFQPLQRLTLPIGMKYQKEGVSRASKVGESMDFFGCREFRDGDEPRHIDWPGSARAGEIIVKEYQEEYLSRIALIVDTFVPGLKSFRFVRRKKRYSPTLEAALSLTAALVDYLTRGEYVVDIFAAGTQIYHFQAGRHLTCFDGILDILACLEPNNEHPINRLSGDVLEEISGLGSAVAIMLGWDQERQTLVERLRGSGVAVKVIIIGDPTTTDIPPDMTIVSPEEIQSGMVSEL